MAGSPLGSNALIRPSAKNCAIFPLAFFEGWFLAYRLKSEHFKGTWIVGHILIEESQHVGQVALLRGMMRGMGA